MLGKYGEYESMPEIRFSPGAILPPEKPKKKTMIEITIEQILDDEKKDTKYPNTFPLYKQRIDTDNVRAIIATVNRLVFEPEPMFKAK